MVPTIPQIFKGLIIICSLNLTVPRGQYIGFVSCLNELERLWKMNRPNVEAGGCGVAQGAVGTLAYMN